MIERKHFIGELKSEGSGALVATFSRFDVVDHDGDVTLASAIPDGTPVAVGSFNHSSVIGTSLPIGKGMIRNDGRRAYIEAQLFDTDAAQAHYQVLKGLGGLAQWSYAFHVVDQSTDYAELREYPGARRILKSLETFEVSPVIRGAGIDTVTDSLKDDLVRDPELTEFARQNELVVMRDSVVALRKRALVQRALRGLVTDAEFDEVLSWR